MNRLDLADAGLGSGFARPEQLASEVVWAPVTHESYWQAAFPSFREDFRLHGSIASQIGVYVVVVQMKRNRNRQSATGTVWLLKYSVQEESYCQQ